MRIYEAVKRGLAFVSPCRPVRTGSSTIFEVVRRLLTSVVFLNQGLIDLTSQKYNSPQGKDSRNERGLPLAATVR